MNVIKINMQELNEIIQLTKDREEFTKTWLHIIENGFIWNEFMLKVIELDQTYKVSIEGKNKEQYINIKKIQYDKNGLVTKAYKYRLSIIEYLERLKVFVLEARKKGVSEIYRENDELIDIIPPMKFMEYIIRESQKRKYEYVIKEEKEIKENTISKKAKKNKIEYNLLDAIKIYQKNEGEKRKYEITCESWDIRGHFRHYKSGKVVWIAPYKKGKKIKEENNKEYKLRSEK